MSRFNCLNCDFDTLAHEYYMLLDNVWHEACAGVGVAPRDGMLCIGCVESAIGRKLNRRDFSDALINKMAINDPTSVSPRLYDRLTLA